MAVPAIAAVDSAQIELPHPWPLPHLVHTGVLTIGITAKDPPLSFAKADGSVDGSRIVLFRKLGEDLGYKVEFVRLDWPAILPGLFANRYDLACEGVSWTPERLSAGGFLLTRPVALTHMAILTRSGGPIGAWQELRGHKLGGVRGETEFTRARKMLPDAIPVAFPGRQEGIMALINAQVDGLALDRATAASIMADPENARQLHVVEPEVAPEPQSVCVNANEPELLEAVDILLSRYRANGTLAAISAQYGNVDDISGLSVLGY